MPQVIRIAKPLVLPAIFYQLQGVVTVFLVSLFGTSNMMAEVGAFGRLAMALMVVDRVTSVLLFPAIARAPNPGARLREIMWRAHLVYLGMMALVLLSAWTSCPSTGSCCWARSTAAWSRSSG